MWPYWIFFGFFALGALLARPDFRDPKPLGVLLLLGALITVLFVGLRYYVGADWPTYRQQFVDANDLTLIDLIAFHKGDAGFYTLMFLLRMMGLHYWALNIVCAAIFTWGLFRFARRLPNPWLAVTVAVPYLTIAIAMSATRQSTALGFVFLALVAYAERRTRGFLGWSAAAVLFHTSAILTVPFAGLSFAKTKFQAILIVVAIGVLGWLVLGSPFQGYSMRYLNESVQSTGLIFRVGMSAVAAVLFLTTVRQRIGMAPHERSLWTNYSLFALAAMALAVAYPTSTALDRMLIYTFPLQILTLSLIPFVSPKETPVLPILAIILYLSAILFVFLNFGVNAPAYIPYRMYPLG